MEQCTDTDYQVLDSGCFIIYVAQDGSLKFTRFLIFIGTFPLPIRSSARLNHPTAGTVVIYWNSTDMRYGIELIGMRDMRERVARYIFMLAYIKYIVNLLYLWYKKFKTIENSIIRNCNGITNTTQSKQNRSSDSFMHQYRHSFSQNVVYIDHSTKTKSSSSCS
jgi:hypothetical protein